MKQYFKQYPKALEILIHILFWVIHFVYRLYLTGYFGSYDSGELFTQLILLVFRIGVTYFTIYVLLYRYFFKGKSVKFSLGLIVSVLVTLLLRRLIHFEIIYKFGLHPNLGSNSFFNISEIAHQTIYIYPVVTAAVIIIVLYEWFKKEKVRTEIAREKLEAELKFLKAQLSPHFLFNTINNIYSLALEQSKKTPEALLKLSDLLNYMLYDSNTESISLSKEIQNLQDYIELEQLRYGNKLDLVFDHKVKSSSVFIPPLLLLPFVENAFKHGAGESIDKSWINIYLREEDKKLTFKIENNFDEKQAKEIDKEGIGLQNVEKRLRLTFDDRYDLKTLKSEDSFLVTLKLDLNNVPE